MNWDWDNLTKEDILEMDRLSEIKHEKKIAKITFWDDICYKKGWDHKAGKLKRIYYSCNSLQHWNKHIATPKYKKMYKAVNEDSDSIKCEHCNQKFSKEGYENHCNRNKELWKWQKIGTCKMMTCNNFKDGGRRFASIEHYKGYCSERGRKKSRANVGEEKVDGSIRLPMNVKNVNKAKYNEKIEKIKKTYVFDTTEEESLDNLKMEITIEPNKKEDLKEGDWVTIEDKEEPTEKEWELIDEFGNALYFEGHCDTCTLPINDEDYSSRLLTYLDIDVCDCD